MGFLKKVAGGLFGDSVGEKLFGWLMPDPPKQLAPGAELTSAETDASIAKIYGKVEKKTGRIVFKETNDNDDDDYPNDLLHIIVVWGEAVESIDEVYIDDIPNSSNDDAFYAGDKRAVFVRNFPNGMGNYSDQILTRAGWRASDKLEGKACSYIRLEYHDDETAITSEPNLTADLTGTTHSNPATALLDYLTNSIYGKGLPSSYINSASFTYAKALCDSDVEEQLGSGVYRDLFSCNVALDTSATVLENVNTLLKPMRGWLPIINGQLTLIIEEDNTPVDQPILEEDILQMGKISEGNKNNRFNRVSVTYYDPEADGSKQEAVYPEPDSELFEQMLAEDNGFLREESVDLKTCRNYYEALEFAKTYLEVSRQQTRTTITLPKWATIYDVGDVVPVTYMSGLPFWDAKLFRIESKEENREEVKLSIREHQPYIYDFFGLGNKPELPDTTYTNKTPDVPTDLNIEHIYDNFVQVKASWVSESQRFDYRVLKGDVIVQTERVASHSVELSGFDMGQYRFQVRALGGLGKRSGWAEIPLVMQVPSPPTSINLNISNFDIEVIPWLENAGSSVSFDYTITDENATEPGELIRGPAASYTFSGLSPITNYKIWVRSHNPLGVSDWVSVEATTHNDAQPITEIIEPILAPITVDIESLKLSVEDIDNRFVDFEAQTLSIVQQERISTEAAQALLLQSISENAAYQLELARRIEQGEELTNAVVYRDPSNGLIVNRAYNYADDKFTEASLKIDGVSGEVELASKRIGETEDAITSLSSELSLVPGIITAKATAIVSESIAALEPAHAFNFFDSAQGWQAVNGTLTAGVNEITVTHGDIENATLNYEASENKLIRVSLQRLSGSGWSGTVIIERDDNSVETYANYVEEASILLVDFSAMPSYSGTVTRVRLVLGADASDEFKLTSITIGKADATTQDLANVTSRVNAAELAINANEAEIAQRVSTSYFNENAITVSNVEQKVNALDTIIALEAKRQELIDNNVIQKAVSAATFLNGQTGTIQDIVQSFEQDIEGVESSISDVQQQVDSLGITEQVAGLASQQIQTYDMQAALLQQAVNDLSAYMQEAETAQSVALAVNQLQIDVSPEGALAKDIGSLQAVTLSNGNAITATNKRLSQVETDAEGNASAIEQLNLSVSGLSGNLTGALSRLDSVETTANGTASAFSGVQAKVQDSQKGNDALFTFAQQIEVTADNAKEGADVANYAVNQLSNAVNNATTGLSATNTIAQRAESKANGAQSSITAIESRLSGAEEKASASLTLATDNKGDIEGIRASILLRTNANGVVSAISLDSQNDVSQIAFQAQQVVTLDDEGNPVIFWDTSNGRYVFIGHIDATTGSFGGKLEGATGTFSGSLSAASGTFTGTVRGGALISSSGTGFRSIWRDDGTYLGWVGQGSQNDTNAVFAIKKAKNGNPAKVLINAQFIEGLSSIKGYNEDDDFNVTVSHNGSVGNAVDITVTAYVRNFFTTESQVSNGTRTLNWRLIRNSTTIKSGEIKATRVAEYEAGSYSVTESADATIIARDNSPQPGNNTYKFEFTGTAATLDTYDLAIRTEENRMAA
ncbi:hypothetical protein ACM257_17790 [Alteromonas macleodii]|uniref:phage tail tip protein J-related protein n=1 Tax=Alteromonas macleodii TaxID=28108 RepID=UPI0039F72530